MVIDEDDRFEDTQSTSINDLNSNSLGKHGDHTPGVMKDLEELTKENRPSNSSSPSDPSCSQKNVIQHTTDTSIKKGYSSKKKKISDVR